MQMRAIRLLAVPLICCVTAVSSCHVYSRHQAATNRRVTVINTWPWKDPNDAAWRHLSSPGGSAIKAVVAACSVAEADPTITSVGAGGSPDENGNTTLSAMVMDGDSMDVRFV